MKICVIANGYPEKRDPQFGCFEKDQAVALKRAGHQVSILFLDSRLRWWWRKIGRTRKSIDGVEIFGYFVFPFNVLSTIPCLGRFSYWAQTRIMQQLFLQLIKEQGKPDVLYAHFMPNISHAVYLKIKNNIPLVGIEHWSRLNQELLPLRLMRMGRLAYDNCDKLLAVSESLRLLIKKHFGNESIVVHNMIGEEFIQLPPSQNRHDGVIRFVSTGSLIHRKGFDTLISALHMVHQRSTSWVLTIIGDGPLKVQLSGMISQYGLDGKVRLVGRKNKHEIIEILHQSDVFVLSSRAENFSVAVLEALSAGLPVVATICGGIRECIHEKNGVLVPVDDVRGLCNALIKVIANNDKYDRKAIADECISRFAPQIITDRLIDIMRSAILEKKQICKN